MFAFALVSVVTLTIIPLSGAWATGAIVSLAVVAFGVSLRGGWDKILAAVGTMNIQINATGYLFFGTSFFALWIITSFVIRQRYIIVSPGVVRLSTGLGDELVFPSAGVVFEVRQDNLFTHFILGFNSGDVIVRTPDGNQYLFPNVNWVRWRLDDVRAILGEAAVPKK